MSCVAHAYVMCQHVIMLLLEEASISRHLHLKQSQAILVSSLRKRVSNPIATLTDVSHVPNIDQASVICQSLPG